MLFPVRNWMRVPAGNKGIRIVQGRCKCDLKYLGLWELDMKFPEHYGTTTPEEDSRLVGVVILCNKCHTMYEARIVRKQFTLFGMEEYELVPYKTIVRGRERCKVPEPVSKALF